MRRNVLRKNRKIDFGITDRLPKLGQMIWIKKMYGPTVVHARRISQQTGIPLSEMFCEGLALWIGRLNNRGGIEKAVQETLVYRKKQSLKRLERVRHWCLKNGISWEDRAVKHTNKKLA